MVGRNCEHSVNAGSAAETRGYGLETGAAPRQTDQMTGSMLSRLRAAFAPRKAGPGAEQLFIDDHTVAGLEVLPASIASWCDEQIAAIADSSEKNFAPGGTGWTDVYVRPPAPTSIADLSIAWEPAIAALAARLPAIKQVVTGSSASPQVITRARAFGPSLLSAVVLYADGDRKTVSEMEMSLRGDANDSVVVLTAMEALPSPQPLLVVDWFKGRYARIGDAAGIAALIARD